MIKQVTLGYLNRELHLKKLSSFGLALCLTFIMVGCGEAGSEDASRVTVFNVSVITKNSSIPTLLSIEEANSQNAIAASSKTTVKLLKRGAEPRRELRYKFQASQTFKVIMEMDMAMAMEMGTFKQPEMKMPVSKMAMTFDCKDISPEGDLHYEFKLEDIEVLSNPGDDPAMVNAMKQQMSSLQGMTGSAAISTRGYIKDTKIILPPGINPQAKQFMDSMNQSINQMSAPFPKELVGEGAIWQVTMPMDTAGMKFTQIATYTLSEMKGDNVKMDVSIKQSAPKQDINNPNAPPGMTLTLESLDSSGKGIVDINLANLIPTSNIITTIITTVTANEQKVKTTMKMGMKIYPSISKTQPSNKTDKKKDSDPNPEPEFPTGQDSPEGVACDMARAYISADKDLWLKINHSTLTNNKPETIEFVEYMSSQMEEMAKVEFVDRPGPKEILKVYKARHLSMNGPASYGYAVFNFEDVMFVDVVALDSDGAEYPNRTLVIKDKSKWYVVPRPDLFPLLSANLNSESESTDLFDNK